MWECPNAEDSEEVDEVAEVEKEVVVAFAVVGEVPNWHEIGYLGCEPIIEASWPCTEEIAADEYVQDGRDE